METYCSENINELALALIDVQKQMSPAAKDGKNPFIGNNYATLNSVMMSCRDILLSHGIWLTQLPVTAPIELGPGYLGLLTKLTHAESGQWQSSLMVIPLPKADPQGMDSAITYARRYALTSMLGMITEDDDAESAKMPPKIQQLRNGNAGQSDKRYQNGNGSQKNYVRNEPAPEKDEPAHEELPQLDGVTYQYTEDQNGRQCIVASGNTHPKKEILRGAGFSWNAKAKVWWKYADAI